MMHGQKNIKPTVLLTGIV